MFLQAISSKGILSRYVKVMWFLVFCPNIYILFVRSTSLIPTPLVFLEALHSCALVCGYIEK